MAFKLWKDKTWARSAQPDCYFVTIRAEGNGTSAPDGAEPAVITWARSGAGEYTFTFPTNNKPRRVLSAHCYIEETGMQDSRLNYCGYVRATGVVRLELSTNTAGTIALADLTDKTLVCELKCSDSPLND